MRATSLFLVLCLSALSLVAGQINTCCDSNSCSGASYCVDDSCYYDGFLYICQCHCRLTNGAIAGLVIGLIILLAACIFCCRRRYIQRQMYMQNVAASNQAVVYQQQQGNYVPPQPTAYAANPYQQQPAQGYAAPNYQGQPQTTSGYSQL